MGFWLRPPISLYTTLGGDPPRPKATFTRYLHALDKRACGNVALFASLHPCPFCRLLQVIPYSCEGYLAIAGWSIARIYQAGQFAICE